MRFFRPFRRGGRSALPAERGAVFCAPCGAVCACSALPAGRGPRPDPVRPRRGRLEPQALLFGAFRGKSPDRPAPRRPVLPEGSPAAVGRFGGRPAPSGAPHRGRAIALTCAEWAARPGWIPDPLPRVKVPRPDFLLVRELLDGSPSRWSGICRAGFEPALSRSPRSRKSRTGPAERTGIRPESLRRTAAVLDPPAQVRLPFQYSAFPARNHGKKVATSLRRLLFSVLQVLFSASFPCLRAGSSR